MMHRPLLHPLAASARPPQHHQPDSDAQTSANDRSAPAPDANKPKGPLLPKSLPFMPASAQQNSRTSSPSRSGDKQRLSRDKDDFSSMLLGDDEPLAPMLPLLIGDGASGESFQPMLSETAETASAAPPPTCWKIIEPALTESIEKQPAFPATFSLLLPQLGEVTAQVNQTHNGELEIALAFSQGSFQAVRGAQDSCGQSLSQRLGQRVRLRFNLRDGRSSGFSSSHSATDDAPERWA